MPPVIGAVVAAIGSTAMASITGTLIMESIFVTFAVNFAVGAVLSVAQSALTPKPKIPNLTPNFSSFGESAQGRLVNVKQAIMTRQVIYGTRRIAGNLVFAEANDGEAGDGNDFLHLIFLVASHEVHSFDSFLINEDVVTLDSDGFVEQDKYKSGSTSFVRLLTANGTDDQVANSTLVTESANWTTNHRLRGIAYIYARLKFSNDIFPNGIPNITSIVKGKKYMTLVHLPQVSLQILLYVLEIF